jgi:hypothetical protein
MRSARIPRQRRYASPYLVALLKPVMRYSFSRDAYILRGVGDRVGPVLVTSRHRVTQPEAA